MKKRYYFVLLACSLFLNFHLSAQSIENVVATILGEDVTITYDLIHTNSFKWEVPKKQKTGSSYSLQLSSAANSSQKATSDSFKIKPKVPLLVIVGIPVVVGVIVAVLVSGGGDSAEPTGGGGAGELPGPISPGG